MSQESHEKRLAADGGRAFPSSINFGDTHVGDVGMSMRDWFAGQALPAMIAMSLEGLVVKPEEKDMTVSQMVSARAYAYADAMLEERSKQ
jgi:hypothetical protein